MFFCYLKERSLIRVRCVYSYELLRDCEDGNWSFLTPLIDCCYLLLLVCMSFFLLYSTTMMVHDTCFIFKLTSVRLGVDGWNDILEKRMRRRGMYVCVSCIKRITNF